jgi:hypothetical protein
MPRLLRAELDGSELLTEFDSIYEVSLKLWKAQLSPKYTTHGRLHSEEVERHLDHLTRPIQSSDNPLSADEIYVLLAGACLHDIGMQLIDDPEFRENHADAVHEMILYSSDRVPSELRKVTLPIEDRNARIAIADVARAHWTEHALQLPQKPFINGNNKGRLRLLGLLLAMADLLDLSSVRAHYFRTSTRFYELPPVSELHHAKHDFVKGCTIGPPNPKIPGALQFEVEWHDEGELVQTINDWVMHWSHSQWRQLKGPLFEESGGCINWVEPWVKVIFNSPKGPTTTMSKAAEHVLRTERADQIRIDRNAFASRFNEALSKKEVVVFLAPVEPDSEWRFLSDWCEAQAPVHQDYKVIRKTISLPLHDPAIIAKEIMMQFELPSRSDEDPIQTLSDFLKQDHSLSLLAIIKTDEPVSKELELLVSTMLLRNSDSGRVCLLLCPKGKGPHKFGASLVVQCAGSLLPRNQIEKHLQKRGYSQAESREIYERMRGINLPAQPSHVYRYIEDHCNFEMTSIFFRPDKP